MNKHYARRIKKNNQFESTSDNDSEEKYFL